MPHNYRVVYIGTTNDTNGNPSRGWIVGYGTDTQFFVDEGYAGRSVLASAGVPPSDGNLPMIQVTPAEYKSWKRI